jgi:alpha-beta hydrolase superfamily lysophospholipase
MGGLLVYAYLSQGGQGLNAVATLGSPTKLDWQGRFESAGVRLANAVLNKSSLLPITTLSELGLYLQPESSEGLLPGMLVNPKNTTGATFKRLSTVGAGDLSGALALQLVSMMQNGGFKSANGTLDYRRDMAKVRVPVLVVAGKTDQIAIVPAVKDGYRALGGEKEWMLLSEENGVEADYGHLDYLIGERAAKELWAHVLAFLEKHRPTG